MSNSVLKIFPVDPLCRPTSMIPGTLAQSIRDIFQPECRISIIDQDDPFFVDQGENFERVVCPLCSKEMEISWWNEAMDRSSRSKFRDLMIIAPCCESRVSLNDLEYEWPAGFASFVIEIQDPRDDIQRDEMVALEEIIGCKLRKIWAYY
jgi:hypothetical protein